MKSSNMQKAVNLAVELHNDHNRKSGIPYIGHPFDVASTLYRWGINNETIYIAALLHDTIEDTLIGEYSKREEYLRSRLDGPWIDLVVELTRTDNSPAGKLIYNNSFNTKRIESLIIKLADNVNNVKDFLIHAEDYAPKYFQKFDGLWCTASDRKDEIDKVFGVKTRLLIWYDYNNLVKLLK